MLTLLSTYTLTAATLTDYPTVQTNSFLSKVVVLSCYQLLIIGISQICYELDRECVCTALVGTEICL